jgi:GT2 family glycosyltransferase
MRRVLDSLAGRTGAIGRPGHNGHLTDRGEVELESLSTLQAGSPDDLDLGQLVVPVADTVDSLGAELHAASEFTNPELTPQRDGAKYMPAPPRTRPADAIGGLGARPAVGVVVDCELSVGVPQIPAPAPDATALVLVRLFGEPIATLHLTLPKDGLTAAQLADAIHRELGIELRARLADCAIGWTGSVPTDGLAPGRKPPFIEGRERALAEGPEITALICSRDRPDDLAQALDGMLKQRYPRLHILVVDNAPSDDRTRQLVSRLASRYDIGYVVEPRPGLSWARNRGIEASHTEVIAFADDDERCDPWWAAEIARAFVEVPEAGAVTGLVAPAELVTEPQLWFEQYSGVRRGRGVRRAVFSPATAARQSPLYPLPPYGAGANMAFRRSEIERIGRFDCALGTGTATLAGEDTAALSALLLAGGTIVYQPSAIVHHRHRRDYSALERVMLGYGRGLSAYYVSMLARHPSCLLELVRLSRQALRDQFSPGSPRLDGLEGFPRELLRINRKGLLQGALMYPGAWLRARRLASTAAEG